jgi:hypothetical protein
MTDNSTGFYSTRRNRENIKNQNNPCNFPDAGAGDGAGDD